MSGRFLISYDHEIPEHRQMVLDLCALLRADDLDVHIDADVECERVDWAVWMTQEIELADRVLVVVSDRYRKRFMREGPLGEGRGVEVEAKIIRHHNYVYSTRIDNRDIFSFGVGGDVAVHGEHA